MSEHWSEYWKSGHLTSFGNEFSENYTGHLRSIWERIFNRLPDNFRLLDIATGNGALPLLAQDHFKKSDVKGAIKGIDFANINSQPLIEHHLNKNISIELIGNVRAESLPFSDSEFDMVISQFGIEYSDIEKSFYEVNRVLVKVVCLSQLSTIRVLPSSRVIVDYLISCGLNRLISSLNY